MLFLKQQLFNEIIAKLYTLYNHPIGSHDIISSPSSENAPSVSCRLLVLSFVPILCALYMRVVHNYYHTIPVSEFNSLSILLLCIYNCEIVDVTSTDREFSSHVTSGSAAYKKKVISIRIVSLQRPSIYHEKSVDGGVGGVTPVTVLMPTEKVLQAHNLNLNDPSNRIDIFGPYEIEPELCSSNYQHIFSVLFSVFNQHIQQLSPCSYVAICHLYLAMFRQSQLVTPKVAMEFKRNIQAYLTKDEVGSGGMDQLLSMMAPSMKHILQIQFKSELLVELTRAVYYFYYYFESWEFTSSSGMENGTFFENFKMNANGELGSVNQKMDMKTIALELIDEITAYATGKLYGDVLLVSSKQSFIFYQKFFLFRSSTLLKTRCVSIHQRIFVSIIQLLTIVGNKGLLIVRLRKQPQKKQPLLLRMPLLKHPNKLLDIIGERDTKRSQ